MSRALALALGLGLGLAASGCKGRARDADRGTAVSPAPGDAAASRDPGAGSAVGSAPTPPVAPDAAAPASALPEVIGPPPPFQGLRPRMKQADALAALADTRATPIEVKLPSHYFIPTDVAFYATPIPHTAGYVQFRGGRLASITILGLQAEPLVGAVTARWGQGTERADPFGRERVYPASTLGWQAALTPPGPTDFGFAAQVKVVLTPAEAAGDALAVTGKVFPQLAGLLGKPLDAAERALPGLRRETADGDERAPERGAPSQGFARLQTPWGPGTWELVLYTDTQGTISFILLTGATSNDDEQQRIALFDALRSTFGELRPAVSEAGRVEIRATAGPTLLRVAEPSANSWWIALVPR